MGGTELDFGSILEGTELDFGSILKGCLGVGHSWTSAGPRRFGKLARPSAGSVALGHDGRSWGLQHIAFKFESL